MSAPALLLEEILQHSAQSAGAADAVEGVLCCVEDLEGRAVLAEGERVALQAAERALLADTAALRLRIAGTSTAGAAGAAAEAQRLCQRAVRGCGA